MDPKRRWNSHWVIACATVVLCFLICMPVATHSFTRGDCYLPPDDGDCSVNSNLLVKYYFDANNDDCSEFIYYGCGGNGNRFDSFEECESLCLFNDQF